MSHCIKRSRPTRKRIRNKYADVGKIRALRNARSLGRYSQYTKRRRGVQSVNRYARQRGGWKYDDLMLATIQYGKDHGIVYSEIANTPIAVKPKISGGNAENGKFDVGDVVVIQIPDQNILFKVYGIGIYESFFLIGSVKNVALPNATIRIQPNSIEAIHFGSGKK